MKKSKLIKSLRCRFDYSEDISELAEQIIDFLVSEGMQPPPIQVQEYLVPAQDGQEALIPYTTIVNQWTPEE